MPSNNSQVISAEELLNDWFSEPLCQHWFRSTPEIDQQLKDKYLPGWQAAKTGQLNHWLENAASNLALIILLDQLPLNMFRQQPESFSTEQQAIAACKQGLKMKHDQGLEKERRGFFYMPLMHSEDIADQELSVSLFEKAGLDSSLRFARHHRDLIRRFGRFPHRNNILGRESNSEELAYLASDQAFLG